MLRCNFSAIIPVQESFSLAYHHSSLPSSFSTAASASLAPARSFLSCSCHRNLTRAPRALSDSSHRSNIQCVAIYCATVLCCRLTYSFIVNNPAASLVNATEMYINLATILLWGSYPFSLLSAWVWNPPSAVWARSPELTKIGLKGSK